MALENIDPLSVFGLVAMFFIVFAVSSGIDMNQFIAKIKQPKGIIICIFCQYLLLPAIAFIICNIFSSLLLPEQQMGLIIMGTMPGGALSNFFCFLFGADLTLSVAMTAMSSLTSFIFVTINGLIYIPIISKTTSLKIDYISLLLSVITLISGLLCGLFVSYKNYKIIQKIVYVIGTILLFVAIFGSLISNFMSGYAIWKLSWPAVISPLLLTTSAYFMSFGIANMFKLSKNSCVAVSIECANQNAPFAMAIMVLTFGHSEALEIALGIPILYSLWNDLLILIVGLMFKKCGYLTSDKNDNALTFKQLCNQWRLKKISTENGNDDIQDEDEDVSTTQTSVDMKIYTIKEEQGYGNFEV